MSNVASRRPSRAEMPSTRSGNYYFRNVVRASVSLPILFHRSRTKDARKQTRRHGPTPSPPPLPRPQQTTQTNRGPRPSARPRYPRASTRTWPTSTRPSPGPTTPPAGTTRSRPGSTRGRGSSRAIRRLTRRGCRSSPGGGSRRARSSTSMVGRRGLSLPHPPLTPRSTFHRLA